MPFHCSDLLKKAELDLKELIASLVTSCRLTEYKVTSLTHADGSRAHTITAAGTADVLSDAPRLLEALRACVQSIIAMRKTELDERTKLLEKKDQELLSLRRILAAMESTDGQHAENVLMSPTTPLRHAPPAATVGAGAAAAGAGVSTQLFQGQDHMPSTPVQKAAASHGHSQAVVMMTPTTSTGAASMGSSAAVRWSGAKSALQHVSPAAKQAAKLHSEVLKEVLRLLPLFYSHVKTRLNGFQNHSVTEGQIGSAAGAAQRPTRSIGAAGRRTKRIPRHDSEPLGPTGAAHSGGSGAA